MDEVLDMIINKACDKVREETRINTTLSFFHKGRITENEAIEELNLSPDEFREADEKWLLEHENS